MQINSAFSSGYNPQDATLNSTATASATPPSVPTRDMATEGKSNGCMSGCTGPVAAGVVNSLARLAGSVIDMISKRNACEHGSSRETLPRA